MNKFDAVIIGAGMGGYTAAIRLAQYGKKVALLEKDKPGGVCLNTGCIPTKALLHASMLYYEANNGTTRSGIEFKGALLNLEKLRRWKNSISERLDRGLLYLFKQYGIEYINGFADVEDGRVKVGDRVLEYENLILATGSSPNIKGALSNIEHWTSTEALDVPEIPDSLLVIGGGVIGVELASIYAMFGSKVFMVEALPSILSFLDKDLREIKFRELKKLGVRIHTSSLLEKYENKKAFIKGQDGKVEEVTVDRILIATGRKPNIEIPQKLGLFMEDGFVKTNDVYETTMDHVFAIGDLIKGPMLAHRAHKDGIKVAEYISCSHKPKKDVIPMVVYGRITLLSVGMSEDDLIREGITYKVGRFPFSANGRSLTMESMDGFCKILGDPDTGKIFGIHVAGRGVDEIAGEMSLAINNNLTVSQIANTIHAHPTLSEALMEAAEHFYKKSIHIPNK